MATFEHTEKERLAHIEALIEDLQPQLDRRFKEAEKLNDEKLDGVRREIDAKAEAQSKAVDKSEQATQLQFKAFIEANDKKGEITQSRLGAAEKAISDGVAAQQSSRYVQDKTLLILGAIIAIATAIILLHP